MRNTKFKPMERKKKANKPNKELILTKDFKLSSDQICYHVYKRNKDVKTGWNLIGYTSNIKGAFNLCGEKALMHNIDDLKTAIAMLNELKEAANNSINFKS